MFTYSNSPLSAGGVTTAQTLPSPGSNISGSVLQQDSTGTSRMWDRYQVCSLELMPFQAQMLPSASACVLGQRSCEQPPAAGLRRKLGMGLTRCAAQGCWLVCCVGQALLVNSLSFRTASPRMLTDLLC